MANQQKLIWVVPEAKGGIRDYSDTLFPFVQDAVKAKYQIQMLTPALAKRSQVREFIEILKREKPDLIHIQHEFGLFGSKTPPFYTFPKLISDMRQALPQTKIIVTAHSVYNEEHRYILESTGWQFPIRLALNLFALPFLRRLWTKMTWGICDATIVHSSTQIPIIEKSGCPVSAEIPLYVLKTNKNKKVEDAQAELINWHGEFFNTDDPLIVVFGFFSFEKAQDVALRAFARLRTNAKLVLAGGARRKADRPYYDHCQELIRGLGIQEKVFVTHYIPPERVDTYFSAARLVVAPFRVSFGSASITQALSRGVPTLASDLPLNQEIQERVPGCLSFFKSEDPFDASLRMDHLLQSGDELAELGKKGQEYAQLFSPEKIAIWHLEFYQKVMNS